jgi:tetratricopeptide (TPR) repeat protein
MARARLLSLALFCLLLGARAEARPLGVSVRPQGETEPSAPAKDLDKAAGLFMAMCLDHFMHGKLEWARQACSQAIEANPQSADAYKVRGYVYLMSHEFESAARDFKAALQLSPNDDQNIAGYGQSLSGLGRFADAVSQFRRALSLAPNRAAYWNGLCWALAGEGRKLDRALDSCNRAMALAPGAAGILNSRAMVYLHLRHFPLAIADYTASLKVEADQASAWFGRGLARLSLGMKMGSLDIVEAWRRDPEVDKLFVQMGVLPAHCLTAGTPGCLPGFPVRPERPLGGYQAVVLHADADQELFKAITGSEIRPPRKQWN